jgi:hypothetical protein
MDLVEEAVAAWFGQLKTNKDKAFLLYIVKILKNQSSITC